MNSYYRAFIKKTTNYFTIIVKTDNTGTSDNNQFQFTGAVGNYRVIATQLDNLIDQNPISAKLGFGNLSNEATITLPNIGIYELKVIPKTSTPFSRIEFDNTGDKLKLLEVKKWGNIKWTSFQNAFEGCENLDVTATDIPDISLGVNRFDNCFRFCSNLKNLNESISNWQFTTPITVIPNMFQNCVNFNINLSNWNTSNVTNIGGLFEGATQFNNGGDSGINNWNVSGVTSMVRVFRETAFNQNIGSWNVGSVTNMAQMFDNATQFNNGGSDSINNWNVSNVQSFGFMFRNANFNQYIGDWNTSSVTNMTSMLRGTPFNQNINTKIVNSGEPNEYVAWNVSNVISTSQMFTQCTQFNQNLGNWKLTKCTNMSGMFSQCINFNNGGSPDINNWEFNTLSTANITMTAIFQGCQNFNQPLGNWNTERVVNMANMFSNGVVLFNQDLSSWDVSNVTRMDGMFDAGAANTSAFNNGGNPDINNWNVGNVTNMGLMFRNCVGFNQPIHNWNVSQVTNFTQFMNGKNTTNYDSNNLDAIYNTWSTLSVQPNLEINFGNIEHTAAGLPGKEDLVNAPNNWIILDGGQI